MYNLGRWWKLNNRNMQASNILTKSPNGRIALNNCRGIFTPNCIRCYNYYVLYRGLGKAMHVAQQIHKNGMQHFLKMYYYTFKLNFKPIFKNVIRNAYVCLAMKCLLAKQPLRITSRHKPIGRMVLILNPNRNGTQVGLFIVAHMTSNFHLCTLKQRMQILRFLSPMGWIRDNLNKKLGRYGVSKNQECLKLE